MTSPFPETETEEKAKREAEEKAQLEAGQEGQTGQEPEPGGTTSGSSEAENAENTPSVEGNKQLHNGM